MKKQQNLIDAARRGDLSTARRLVTNGNDLSRALKEAAKGGHFEIVKLIIEKVFNVDECLVLAIESGNLEMVKYLVKINEALHDKETLRRNLGIASSCGHLEIVKFFLGKTTNFSSCNDDVLIRSAGDGHLNVVEYSLKRGANIHADNDSALHGAVRNGYAEVTNYLIVSGACVDDRNGRTLRRVDHFATMKCMLQAY